MGETTNFVPQLTFGWNKSTFFFSSSVAETYIPLPPRSYGDQAFAVWNKELRILYYFLSLV